MTNIKGVTNRESSTDEIIQHLRASETEWKPYVFARMFGQAAAHLETLKQQVDELERYYALYQRGVNFNKARNIISGD